MFLKTISTAYIFWRPLRHLNVDPAELCANSRVGFSHSDTAAANNRPIRLLNYISSIIIVSADTLSLLNLARNMHIRTW